MNFGIINSITKLHLVGISTEYLTVLPVHKQECTVLTLSSTASHIDAVAATRMGIAIDPD